MSSEIMASLKTVLDQGPQLISQVWWNFMKFLGLTVSLSSGYHPQSNGQSERKIQEISHFLRTYCHTNQHSWSRFLPWAEYAQNSLKQASTGLISFQCMLGYQPPLFLWSGEPSQVPAVDNWFKESERVWTATHIKLSRVVRRQKSQADTRRSDRPQYHLGQKVWLSTHHLSAPVASKLQNSSQFPCITVKTSPPFSIYFLHRARCHRLSSTAASLEEQASIHCE